jgi:hypothetical protein
MAQSDTQTFFAIIIFLVLGFFILLWFLDQQCSNCGDKRLVRRYQDWRDKQNSYREREGKSQTSSFKYKTCVGNCVNMTKVPASDVEDCLNQAAQLNYNNAAVSCGGSYPVVCWIGNAENCVGYPSDYCEYKNCGDDVNYIVGNPNQLYDGAMALYEIQ